MPVAKKKRPVGRPRKAVQRRRATAGTGAATQIGKAILKEVLKQGSPLIAKKLISGTRSLARRKRRKRGKGVRLAGRGAYLA